MHSGFFIPVVKDGDDVVSSLTPHSKRADLINIAPFICLDEFPMQSLAVAEAIDSALCLICSSDEPFGFGGKIIIAIGDFRQVAPIVPYGKESAAFQASILSWPIWKLFHTLELTQPIHNAQDLELSEFVDNIGEDYSGS